MEKIIKFEKPEEMLDLMEWDWCDFKTLFDTIEKESGAEIAWQAIHKLWQVRAGEKSE